MKKLQTHQERMEECAYASISARGTFNELQNIRKRIEEALLTKDPYTRYQRHKLQNAVWEIEKAETLIFDFERSCHADAQGYSIER